MPDRDGEGTGPNVHLSEKDLEHARRVAVDHRAATQELMSRYASPEERSDVGSRIDPDTAWVFFTYAEVLDPYGDGEVPEEASCVGRMFFAVDPVEGVAVEWSDLPETTREALEGRREQAHKKGWEAIFGDSAAGT